MFFEKPDEGIPLWVGQLAAFTFIVAGIACIYGSIGNKKMAGMSMLMMGIALLVLFNWVAFGPGERMGLSSFGIPGLMKTSVTKTNTRPGFIVMVSSIDLVALIFIVSAIRDSRKNEGDGS